MFPVVKLLTFVATPRERVSKIGYETACRVPLCSSVSPVVKLLTFVAIPQERVSKIGYETACRVSLCSSVSSVVKLLTFVANPLGTPERYVAYSHPARYQLSVRITRRSLHSLFQKSPHTLHIHVRKISRRPMRFDQHHGRFHFPLHCA